MAPLALIACGSERAASEAEPAAAQPAAAEPGEAAQRVAAKARASRPQVDATADTRVLFIGNSFTRQGPVPDLVAQLAEHAGFVNVTIDFRAVDGRSLAWHRADPSAAGAPARLREGWDVVVLQDYSTRPTRLGDPQGFKDDIVWFAQQAQEANSSVRIVLYETWARRAGHPLYPSALSGPAQMQGEVRAEHLAAANQVTSFVPRAEVTVARVGDAWELQLGRDEALRLHAADDYHAGPAGQYLSAAVLFGTVFDKPAAGLPAINVSDRTAAELQATADAVTGHGVAPAPATEPKPPTDPSFNAS